MARQPAHDKLTFEQYLAVDDASAIKIEYRGGDLFAMSGSSAAHARLSARLIYLLTQQCAHCQVFTSDMRLYVPSANEAMYPDVTVVCEPLAFHQDRTDILLNPTLVVEVLSPSSAAYDKSLKAQFYRQIPSLKVILLVDSERRYIQIQTRQADGNWILEEVTAAPQMLSLAGWTFSFDEIYIDILP